MGATVALAIAARRAPTLDRVRRLRTRSGLPLPGAVRDGLSAALARADVDVTPDDAVKLWFLAALVGAGLAGVLSPLASLPFGIAVLAGGPVALWWARGRGDERVVQALPGALDRVVGGASSRSDGRGEPRRISRAVRAPWHPICAGSTLGRSSASGSVTRWRSGPASDRSPECRPSPAHSRSR